MSLEPPSQPPTCVTCRHWGTPGDGGGMHRKCQEEENLQELGERLRAMWEKCPRWTSLRH